MDVKSLWHPLTQHKSLQGNPPPRMVKSEGCYLTDEHGDTYLDAVAGIWCVNVGYGRRELVDAAQVQMMNLPYLAPTMSHDAGILLADKLVKLLNMEGQVYFTSSGSEANEAAFKMVWQYHAQSGKSGAFARHKIIARPPCLPWQYAGRHERNGAGRTQNGLRPYGPPASSTLSPLIRIADKRKVNASRTMVWNAPKPWKKPSSTKARNRLRPF